MRRVATRGALIGVMLSGGLLYAGISQAQDAGVPSERDAELAAAVGGPAQPAHLIPYEADTAAVDVRDDDVAAAQPAGDKAAPKPVAAAPSPAPATLASPKHP